MSKGDLEVLRAIEERFGLVTADNVIEAARDPDHAWHDRFVWDDQVAGHKHRQFQARQIIRSVRYERRTETRVLSAVAYVRDPDADPNQQMYASVVSLAGDEDRARGAILAEFARVASALKRAREVADILGMTDRVASMLIEVEGLQSILRAPISPGPQAAQ